MKITIITVGKIKEKYLKDAIAEYSKRLSRYMKLEIIELSEEIDKWNEQYGGAGPYTSESFAGYSYTKATAKDGGTYTWKDEFASQLKRWRKICPY